MTQAIIALVIGYVGLALLLLLISMRMMFNPPAGADQ